MDGFLLVDKPLGLSSFDVIRRLNRRFMIGRSGRKLGHGGTLDPMATGLLVVAVGRATRLLQFFLHSDKRYLAEIALGAQTSTDDLEGEVIATSDCRHLKLLDIQEALKKFEGVIEQVPPSFCAAHVDGVRAYDLARHGAPVALNPRQVTVHGIEIVSASLQEKPVLTLDIRCSGGTYIRSIARDLGLALGTHGHLTALRRVEACHFEISQAHTLDALVVCEDLDARLVPCARALSHFPCLLVSPKEAGRLLMGQPVDICAPAPGTYRIQTSDAGDLLAVMTRTEGGTSYLRFQTVEQFRPLGKSRHE